MAKEYINDVLAAGKSVELDGKVLIAEAKNFTFPKFDEGKYAFKISKDGSDYEIKPLVLNEDKTDFVEADEPVIFTQGKDIFFYQRRVLAPYLDNQLRKEAVEDDQIMELQLLAAFEAYAKSEFSLGVYNILLSDELHFEETEDKTTTTTTSTSTTTTTTVKE